MSEGEAAVPGQGGGAPTTPPEVREAAMAAVREAVASEEASENGDGAPPPKADSGASSGAAAERGKDGKFLPKDGKKAEGKAGTSTNDAAPNPDEELVTNSKVAKLLREREERNEQKQQIRQEMQELARMKAEFAQQQAEVAKEKERLKRYRTDPVAALREAHKEYGDAWSPEDFIQTLAKHGTAEGATAREIAALREEQAETKRVIAEYTKRETEYREQLNQQHQNQQALSTEKRFVGVAMNEEKYPHLFDQYEGMEHVLVDMAHKVGQDYHAKTGEWATDEEIAEYLDGVRKERISKRQGSKTSGSASGNATPSRAQGSRTVTTAGASEKRVVTQTSDEEMTEDERREAAKAAVKQATREYAARG